MSYKLKKSYLSNIQGTLRIKVNGNIIDDSVAYKKLLEEIRNIKYVEDAWFTNSEYIDIIAEISVPNREEVKRIETKIENTDKVKRIWSVIELEKNSFCS